MKQLCLECMVPTENGECSGQFFGFAINPQEAVTVLDLVTRLGIKSSLKIENVFVPAESKWDWKKFLMGGNMFFPVTKATPYYLGKIERFGNSIIITQKWGFTNMKQAEIFTRLTGITRVSSIEEDKIIEASIYGLFKNLHLLNRYWFTCWVLCMCYWYN